MSNQLVVEEQNREPLLVAKARQYIGAYKTEEISLANVAAAAGASIFHFSKAFHKSTGLTFTDYLGRVRAEGARTKLLNPNACISEVAYDSGFQSLTQFNRTFKRVFGQSPSQFRAQLHPKKARSIEFVSQVAVRKKCHRSYTRHRGRIKNSELR